VPTTLAYYRHTLKYITNTRKYNDEMKKREQFNQKYAKGMYLPEKSYTY
jgi:hypothetical protein